jgi:hypothetical protein
VGVVSLLAGMKVGSLLDHCGAIGGDIAPDTEPDPPLLENLMAELHQQEGTTDKNINQETKVEGKKRNQKDLRRKRLTRRPPG